MIAMENMMRRNRIVSENKKKFQRTSTSDFALELNEKHRSRRSENEIGDKKKTKKLNDRGIEKIQTIISEGEITQKCENKICGKEKKKCEEQEEEGKRIEEVKESEEIGGRVRNKKNVLKENNDNYYCKSSKKELNIDKVLQKVYYNKTKIKETPNLNDKKEVEKRIEVGEGIRIDKEVESKEIILKENETSLGREESTNKREIFGKIVEKLEKSRQIFLEETTKEEDTNKEVDEFQKMICEKNENNFAIVEEVENLVKMKEFDTNREGLISVDDTNNNCDKTDENEIGTICENIFQSPALRRTTHNERFIKFYMRSKLWLKSRPVFKSIFRSINDSNPSNTSQSGDFEESLQDGCAKIEQETNEEQNKEEKKDEEQEKEEGNNIFGKRKQKRLLGNNLFVGKSFEI